MNKVIVVRFIAFIFLSLCIFCYMENTLTLQVPDETEIEEVSVIKVDVKDSYKIWETIEAFEDSWDKSKQAADFKITLLAFGVKYPYLKVDIDHLIGAQEKKNRDDFLKYKEALMKELRPLWAEQQYGIRQSWWQWFKNGTQNLLYRIYSYFPSFTAHSTIKK